MIFWGFEAKHVKLIGDDGKQPVLQRVVKGWSVTFCGYSQIPLDFLGFATKLRQMNREEAVAEGEFRDRGWGESEWVRLWNGFDEEGQEVKALAGEASDAEEDGGGQRIREGHKPGEGHRLQLSP